MKKRFISTYHLFGIILFSFLIFSNQAVSRPLKTIDISNNKSVARGVSVDPTGKYAVLIGGHFISIYTTDFSLKIKNISLGKGYTDGVSFSPDGKFITAIIKESRINKIVIWHFPSLKVFKTIPSKDWLWRVALTQKSLVYAVWKKRILVLDRRTFKPTLEFKNVKSEEYFSVSADGERLFVRLKTAEVASLHTGKLIFSLQNQNTIWETTISKSGKYLAAGYKKGFAVWDGLDGRLIINKTVSKADHIRRMAFSDDESYLICGDDKGQIFIYSTNGWQKAAGLSDTGGKITGLAAIPGGSKFIAAGWDGRVHLYDLAALTSANSSNDPVRVFYSMHSKKPAALSPLGTKILFSWLDANNNPALLIRSLRTGEVLGQFTLMSQYRINSLAFIDEDNISAVTLDRQLFRANVKTGTLSKPVTLPARGSQTVITQENIIQLSPGGKVYVLSASGQTLQSLDTGFKNASLTCSHDASRALLWNSSGTIQVYDIKKGSVLLKKEVGQIRSAAISPDGSRLALALPQSGKLNIISLPSGSLIVSHDFPWLDKKYFALFLSWSYDGKMLSAGHWYSIIIYDQKGSRKGERLSGAFDYINYIITGKSNNYLVGGNVEGYFYVWELKSGGEAH